MRKLVAKVRARVPERALVVGGMVVAICVAVLVSIAVDALAPAPHVGDARRDDFEAVR
ncbi:hypothetical protein [Xanthobacter agilis]|uniref:hypothetical protein n=1 Tax=Xanthobacter agilis TaxID=47492 RepID=UPI00372A2A46